MGTSTSHPSPKSIQWSAVSVGYQTEQLPPERVLTEVWRAAARPDSNIRKMLKLPIMFRLRRLAIETEDPKKAGILATKEISSMKQSSVVADIAKRAVTLAALKKEGGKGFGEALFGEVANYLVSRDLSGYVGKKYRNATVKQAIDFKKELRERTVEVVRKIEKSPDSEEAWALYIDEVISELTQS